MNKISQWKEHSGNLTTPSHRLNMQREAAGGLLGSRVHRERASARVGARWLVQLETLRIPVHADSRNRRGSDSAEVWREKDRMARKLKSMWFAQWVSPFRHHKVVACLTSCIREFKANIQIQMKREHKGSNKVQPCVSPMQIPRQGPK